MASCAWDSSNKSIIWAILCVAVLSGNTFNGINAVPIPSGTQCESGCPNSNKGGKLNYQTGQKYIYDLESAVKVALAGSDAQETTLSIVGQALLNGVSSDCQYSLRLQNLIVTGPDTSKSRLGDANNLASNLEKSIRFTLSNDELSGEICTDPSDPAFSVNLKRAVASLLQSVNGQLTETDVFGICPTLISVSKNDDGSQTVSKTRNLNACRNRETIANGFVSSIFNDRSSVKSTPLLNGDYNAEQRINQQGIVESVKLTEDYVFTPSSTLTSGARAHVVTKLTLKSQSAETAPKLNSVTKPQSIIFDNPDVVPLKNYEEIERSIKSTIATYTNNVGPKAASQFTELIRSLRHSKKDDILKAYQNIKSGTIDKSNQALARKIFLDALFRAGTANTIEALAGLLKGGKEIEPRESRLAFLSFNLATSVNKETITAVAALVDANIPREGYLSIGTLVDKYCSSNNCKTSEIQPILDKLAGRLGKFKVNNKRKVEDLNISVLKAIRNTNNLVGNAIKSLIEYSNGKHPLRVRVAAIQAFRAGACIKEIQTAALGLLKDINEDPEIRIEAYLGIASCSSEEVANEIRNLLENEESWQVGSFITSHIASLRSSTDAYRQQSRAHLANIRSSKKFPSDVRQYSFNRELSYSIDSLGIGGSVDTDVIYSPKSFLPRSLRTNLTGTIFGNEFNVLELNGRQENLDALVEHVLGPKGTLNTGNKEQVVSDIIKKYHADGKRDRRDLKGDAQSVRSRVKLGEDANRDVDLDLSIKLFGSELYFLSLSDNLPLDGRDFLKSIQNWYDQGAKKLKEGIEYTYESHALFLDANLVYPTGAGLPLKFTAQGAGVARLQAGGNIDIKQFAENPTFRLQLVPSYNVELTGTLNVDAFTVSTGLQVAATVHSSTGAELLFNLVDKKVSVRLNLPIKKQELFNFSHKILFVTQERGKETIPTSLKFTKSQSGVRTENCFDQLKQIIGITACVDSVLAGRNNSGVALFPLNGPSRGAIYLEVDRSFSFEAEYNDKKENHRALTFVFDTPGSEDLRKTIITWEGSNQTQKLYTSLKFDSPFRVLSAETGVLNNDAELSLFASANDAGNEYLAKIGFKKSGPEVRKEYEPIIKFKTPSNKEFDAFGYKVNGKVIVDKSNLPKVRYEFNNIELVDNKNTPIGLTGYIAREDVLKYEVDATLSRKPQSITVKGKLGATDQPRNLYADLNLATTQINDLANGRVRLEYERSDKKIKNYLLLALGKDSQPKDTLLECNNEWNYEIQEEKLIKLDATNEIKAPFIPASLILNGGFNDKLIRYNIGLERNQQKIASQLTWKHDEKASGDWDLAFKAAVNAHKLDLVSVRTIDKKAQQSSIHSQLTSSAGTNVVLDSTISNKLAWNDADLNIAGSAVFVANQEPYKFNTDTKLTSGNAKSDGKLEKGAVEWASYKLNVDRPADANGQYNVDADIKVQDKLNANVQLKSVKRAGTLDVLVSLPKLPRELKWNTKFNLAAPRFDISNEISYDADPAKKIVIETKNKYSKNSINSENAVEISGNKYAVNLDGSRSGESINNGQIKGKLLVRLPSNREIKVTLDRNLNTKIVPAQGKGTIKITDTVQVGGKKTRSATLDASLSDGDFKQRFFNIVHTLELVDFDGKNIIIDNKITHLPKGQFKSGSAGLTIKGALIPNTFDVLLSVEEYCPVHAVYTISSKYGGSFNFNVKGNYHVGERGVKPSTYELNAEAAIPQSKLKSVKLETKGSLQRPSATDVDGQYDLKFNLAGNLNEKRLSLDTSGKIGLKKGNIVANLNVPEESPVNVDLSYSREINEKNKHADGAVSVSYGNGKLVKFSGSVDNENNVKTTIKGSLQTPYEQAKSSEIEIVAKNENNSLTVLAKVKVDEKECTTQLINTLSSTSPSIDIDVKCLPNHHIQFNAGLRQVSVNREKLVFKLSGVKDYDIDVSVDVSHESIENLALIVDANVPKIKIDKARLDIQAKPNAGGSGVRGFEIKASNGGKNILNGFADYQIKEEKGKTVISGNGNVKWYDEQQKASFDLVRTNLIESRDGEVGTLLVFNGNIGTKKIVAEFKQTNKQFLAHHTVCQASNQCTNLEARSTFESTDINNFAHSLLVTINLREWGYEHEFNLKSDTKRNGWVLDYNLDMHLQSLDKSKYQWNVYINPAQSGVVLAVPSRTVAVEANYKIPQEILGKYDASVTTYLDKVKQPNKHSTVGFSGEIKRGSTENSFVTSGALKFSHPNVKELKVTGESELNPDTQSLSGSLLFDVFKTTNQAILVSVNYGNSDRSQRGFNLTSELKVESKELGIDYLFAGHAGANLDRRQLSLSGVASAPTKDARVSSYVSVNDELVEVILTAFNEELIRLTARLDVDKQNAAAEASARILGVEPITGKVEVIGASVKGHVQRGDLIRVNGEITPTKEANLEVLGSGKQLLKTRISFSPQDFLASEYQINDKDFKDIVGNIKSVVTKDTDRAREQVSSKVNQVKENLSKQVANIKDNLPDLSNLNNDYQQELKQLQQELLSVKSIEQVVNAVQNSYRTVSEISQVVINNIKKLSQLLSDFFQQLWEGVNEHIVPALNETLKKLTQLFATIYEELANLIINALDGLVKRLKSLEGDFAKTGKAISESFRAVAEFVSKYVEAAETEFKELFKLFIDSLKGIPGINELRDQLKDTLKGLNVSENVVAVLHEIKNNLKDILPTNELRELLQQVITYLDNKLSNKKVDDLDSLKIIYTSLIRAVRSIIDLVRPYVREHIDAKLPSSWWTPVPLSFESVRHLPQVPTVKSSLLNYIRNEELPSLKDALRTYRPHEFNPLNILPPFEKLARIIDGTHVFTFDGRHLTVPGACQYILAQDVVNGNFTIVGTITGGALKSIAILDKNGDTIELSAEGPVKVNGANNEFPVHQSQLHAWREIYSVSILSAYGARVECKTDLKVCLISISGYYHNQVRGLLGNANAEAYDDYQLPTGKIGNSLNDLTEAYKLQSSCPAVNTEDTHNHDKDDAVSEQCQSIFSWSSPLRSCYYLIDPEPYRDACVHSVASATNKEEAACNIALGYAAYCRSENIFAYVPKNCSRCKVSDASGKETEYEVGQRYTVVNPQKQADIVLVVDTAIGDKLDGIVDTTITELRKELKVREITDARIAVIGYNKNDKFLNRYTTKGSLDITGKFAQPKWKPNPELQNDVAIKTGCKHVDQALSTAQRVTKQLRDDLGLSADAQAFRSALQYPFRSTAGKAIIAIRSDTLTHSLNPLKSFGAFLANNIAINAGIGVHAIVPTVNLTYDNQKDIKQLVGFNSKLVLQLSDVKKRTNIGSTELRSHLVHGSDLGIDIVQSTKTGYIFSLNNYNNLPSDKERKQFIGVIANALADELARNEVTNECVCYLHHGMFAKELCLVKESKELPPVKKANRRG